MLQGSGRLKIPVNRSTVLEDSYNHILRVVDVQQFRLQLEVDFAGERGLDCGGLSRYKVGASAGVICDV